MSDYEKNMKMNEGAPDSYCVLPWSRISIKPNGTYRLCCNSDPNMKTGNTVLNDENGRPLHVSQSDWETVFNTDIMKSVRRTMLAGKWPAECVNCQIRHENGIPALNSGSRVTLAKAVESENYPGYVQAKAFTQQDGGISLDNFPCSDMDLRFGNLCNLKCVMCGPRSSNSWYNDYKALWGMDYFFEDRIYESDKGKINGKPNSNKNRKPNKNVFNWSENPILWLQIEKNLINTRKVYITGGEPLLIKAHFNFLKKCIEKNVAKKIMVSYNSNLTYIPDKVWELWKHFKQIEIGISLDGLGRINDFIRFPSEWNQIEKNFKKLDIAEGNFIPNIHTTLSSLNIWHLPEFIEYIIKSNFKKIGKITPLMHCLPVRGSDYLCPSLLENNYKEKIKNRFDVYKKKIANMDWQSHCGDSRLHNWKLKTEKSHAILDSYVKYMYKMHYSKKELLAKRKTFIYFMDKLDQLRKTNWPETFPELYKSTLEWRKLK